MRVGSRAANPTKTRLGDGMYEGPFTQSWALLLASPTPFKVWALPTISRGVNKMSPRYRARGLPLRALES